ncbi:MAG: hypothetical protein LC795_14835 [Acidobacteria bacterium]|nr:hypothetical protein [Acidobacteriota bacterium]
MSNLSVNYEAGIEEAIGHLGSLGHSEIAYVGGRARPRSAARRPDAFRGSMRRHLHGARVRFHHGDFKLEGGRRAPATEAGRAED